MSKSTSTLQKTTIHNHKTMDSKYKYNLIFLLLQILLETMLPHTTSFLQVESHNKPNSKYIPVHTP